MNKHFAPRKLSIDESLFRGISQKVVHAIPEIHLLPKKVASLWLVRDVSAVESSIIHTGRVDS